VELTDTHCHLDFDRFDPDRPAVLERAWQAGLCRILIPGITLESSRKVVALTADHPNLFAAVGLHPNDAGTWNDGSLEGLRKLAAHPKVVAIGEIGLDYYHEHTPRQSQQEVLRQQLALAAEFGLPVVIHLREAADSHEDGPCIGNLLKILQAWVSELEREGNPLAARPGVLHSYSGSLEAARAALALGFYIGVSGPVTFLNARSRQTITAEIPLDRLLVETDAPFLAPHPYRGRRNEPAYVRLITDTIAGLHSRPPAEVAAATTANAVRLFAW
jgi:TatD DNase family protein